MVKSIIKEVFIILLLVIAIVLVLGILFYEYIPSTQKIPTTVQGYTLPEEMQEELDETIEAIGTQNIVQTYTVDREDLYDYEKSNDYEKGKPNPFSATTSIEENTNNIDSDDKNNGANTNETPSNGTGIQGSFLNTVK